MILDVMALASRRSLFRPTQNSPFGQCRLTGPPNLSILINSHSMLGIMWWNRPGSVSPVDWLEKKLQ